MKNNGLVLLVVVIILIAVVPLINMWQKQKLATDLAISKAEIEAKEKIAEDAARIAEANKVQQTPTLYYVRVPYYIPYPHPHPHPGPPPPPPPPMP